MRHLFCDEPLLSSLSQNCLGKHRANSETGLPESVDFSLEALKLAPQLGCQQEAQCPYWGDTDSMGQSPRVEIVQDHPLRFQLKGQCNHF